MYNLENFLERVRKLNEAKNLTKLEILFISYLNEKTHDEVVDFLLSYTMIEKDLSICPSSIIRTVKSLINRNVIYRKKIKNRYSYRFKDVSFWEFDLREKNKEIDKVEKAIDKEEVPLENINSPLIEIVNEIKKVKKESPDVNIRMEKTMSNKNNKTGYSEWERLSVKKNHDEKYHIKHYSTWTSSSTIDYIRKSFIDEVRSHECNPNRIQISRGQKSYMKLKEIQDKIYSKIGICNNLIIKALVDWFTSKYLMAIYNNKTDYNINVSLLCHEKIVNLFIETFSLLGSTEGEIELSLKSYKSMDCSEKEDVRGAGKLMTHLTSVEKEEMDETYSIGVNRMLMNYGIVLSINYMNRFTDLSVKEIYNSCQTELKNIKNRKESSLISIIEKTYDMSPYEDKMLGLDWKERYSQVLERALIKSKGTLKEVGSSDKNYSFLI